MGLEYMVVEPLCWLSSFLDHETCLAPLDLYYGISARRRRDFLNRVEKGFGTENLFLLCFFLDTS